MRPSCTSSPTILLDYDLLPGEAFKIGEVARDAQRAYKGKPKKGKPADQRLKDAASTAKSKARLAAAKDEALAESLEAQLAAREHRRQARSRPARARAHRAAAAVA